MFVAPGGRGALAPDARRAGASIVPDACSAYYFASLALQGIEARMDPQRDGEVFSLGISGVEELRAPLPFLYPEGHDPQGILGRCLSNIGPLQRPEFDVHPFPPQACARKCYLHAFEGALYQHPCAGALKAVIRLK